MNQASDQRKRKNLKQKTIELAAKEKAFGTDKRMSQNQRKKKKKRQKIILSQ